MTMLRRLLLPTFLLALSAPLSGQESRIKDLTVVEGAVPVRLVGYGLVVGLDGTGDRSLGGSMGASHTVRSVTNLLRRFDVVVPEERLRVRNVAAVLVTAEISPYARPGSKFEIQVSSIGDATSLEGGVLWMTPLVTDAGEASVATAQGPLLGGASDPRRSRGRVRGNGSSARLPDGGVLEMALPATSLANNFLLGLKSPDLSQALRIAEAINRESGGNAAQVTDPGAVRVTVPAGETSPFAFLARVESLPVQRIGAASLTLDSRTGLVLVEGPVQVSPASVSYNGIVLNIGGGAPAADAAQTPGAVRVAAGTPIQDVVAALQGIGAKPQDIAGILSALRDSGAIRASLTIR